MNHSTKVHNLLRRKNRIRSRVHGSASRPRLTVFVSLRHVTAQLIDDDNHKTIATATTVGKKLDNKSMTEKAAIIGDEIAVAAIKKAKVKQVVFDRNGKLYHGRVKALADAARKSGLEF
jgi:large subunit ribosomal protein L18